MRKSYILTLKNATNSNTVHKIMQFRRKTPRPLQTSLTSHRYTPSQRSYIFSNKLLQPSSSLFARPTLLFAVTSRSPRIAQHQLLNRNFRTYSISH
jgi:hypothetical protein